MSGVHHLDGIARVIFQTALDTDRAGELLDCLFRGGLVTIDARTDELVLLPADELDKFARGMRWE